MRIVLSALVLAWMSVAGAAAHQDSSFQNRATAGMFEDMYDYLTYSPAYLPSFAKNVFWGQLSNLMDQNDLFVENSPGSDHYFIGGTTDQLGPGRLGVVFDWSHYTEPVENYAGMSFFIGPPDSHYGFGEYDFVEYADSDGDNIIDLRREEYARSSAEESISQADVYACYGLGNIADLDLGLGVRGQWANATPTYSPSTPFSMGIFPFDQYVTYREYDLVNNQPIMDFVGSSSGSWSYGYSDWRLILSARSQDALGLMSGLGLVVNLAPMLLSRTNEYEDSLLYDYDLAPADPAITNAGYQRMSEKGCQPYYDTIDKPASGFGVDADVRADYDLSGVHLTGWIDMTTQAWSLNDAKLEQAGEMQLSAPTTGGQNIQRLGISNTYAWEGKGGNTDVRLKLRAQFPFTGWRLGLGLIAGTSQEDSEETETLDAVQTERDETQNSDLTDDDTMVVTYHQKRKTTSQSITDTLELPVGMVIDVLKNFSIQLGASHVITRVSYTRTGEILENPVPIAITTRDDGVVTSSIPTSWDSYDGDFNAEQTSTLEVYQYTDFYYGITWLPFEQIQIDLYGFNRVDEPRYYRASVSLYY